MFQNVINQNQVEQEEIKPRKINFKELFKINDIVLYAIAFLVSMVNFNDISPFGLAIFAAACSNKIPVGILYVAVAPVSYTHLKHQRKNENNGRNK